MIYTIDGSSDDERLEGTWGADRIDGKAGDDILGGHDGNDILIGGRGNDRLDGGYGSDRYLFNRGDGQDLIHAWHHDSRTLDTIDFGAGIAPADVELHQFGPNLIIELVGTQDSLTVEHYFAMYGWMDGIRNDPVDQIRFADGTVWNREAIRLYAAMNGQPLAQLPEGDDHWFGAANVDGGAGNDELHAGHGPYHLAGGAGNDVLIGAGYAGAPGALLGGQGNDRIEGGDADEIIVGGTGNDSLAGGAGRNTYVFAHGFGQDTLHATRPDQGLPLRHDLVFGDIGSTGVTVTRSEAGAGNDLIISVRGMADSLRIVDFFAGATIDSVSFSDGVVWLPGDLHEASGRPVRPDLVGGDGPDTLHGSFNDDVIVGGAGNDYLRGFEGHDLLSGGEGSDMLIGGQGDDTYIPGSGDTYIEVGEGADTVLFGRATGHVMLDSYQAGVATVVMADDVLPGDVRLIFMGRHAVELRIDDSQARLVMPLRPEPEGYSLARTISFADGTRWDGDRLMDMALSGDEQDNYLQGLEQRDDRIDGKDGRDELFGWSGNDVLRGGAGDDLLGGGDGDDTLEGGTGQDRYSPSAGRDVILFKRGDGMDIVEWFADPGADNSTVLRLGGGITPDEVDLRLLEGPDAQGLIVEIGAGDAVHVPRFHSSGSDRYRLEAIEFDDGTVWDLAVILSQPVTGTPGDDHMQGGAGDDRLDGRDGNDDVRGADGNDQLVGGAGNDILFGEAGVDTLSGGSGENFLAGGAGNDVYLFERGDGIAIIADGPDYDGAHANVLRFGAGVDASRLEVRIAGSELHIDGMEAGQIKLVDGGAGFNKLEFADGSVAWLDELARRAPVLQESVQDAEASVATPFTLVLKPGTFLDKDAGDVLTYRAAAADGAPWPAWLSFDPVRGTFSGTPAGSDAGRFEVALTVTDSTGRSASDVFVLTVHAANLAPSVAWTPPAVTVDEGFAFALAAPRFIDANADDTLSVVVTGADGAALPSWMSFDAASNTLVGASDFAAAGVYAIEATATDRGGLSASTTFSVTVANVNRAPVLANALPAQAPVDGKAFSFVVPETTFSDPDAGDGGGDSGAYSTSALPAWLSFNAATRTFSGTPGSADLGATAVTLHYTDAGGLAASASLALQVGAAAGLTLTGTAAADRLTGKYTNDTLNGLGGDDILDGGAGADALSGGTGNDSYVVDNLGDVVTEVLGAGTDTVTASVSYALPANVEKLVLAGTGAINGSGNALANTLTGNGAANLLDGGAGADSMTGGAGNDVYMVDHLSDHIIEWTNGGLDQVFTSVTRTLPDNAEVLNLTGTLAINGNGNAVHNLVAGNGAANLLNGQLGYDIMLAGAGNDTLTDTSSHANLFGGGAGADSMSGGIANEMFIGGAGNDTIDAKSGRDILVFNKGDGQDLVISSGGADNILSLGRVAYEELALQKSGKALIVKLGATDQITFQGWYDNAGASVARLQVIIESGQGSGQQYAPGSASAIHNQKVELFDFANLVKAFNTALAADPALVNWNMAQSMAASATGGSDSAAIGGDLAYRYALDGDLAQVGFNPALAIIGSATFGAGTQTLLGTALVDGSPMLF